MSAVPSIGNDPKREPIAGSSASEDQNGAAFSLALLLAVAAEPRPAVPVPIMRAAAASGPLTAKVQGAPAASAVTQLSETIMIAAAAQPLASSSREVGPRLPVRLPLEPISGPGSKELAPAVAPLPQTDALATAEPALHDVAANPARGSGHHAIGSMLQAMRAQPDPEPRLDPATPAPAIEPLGPPEPAPQLSVRITQLSTEAAVPVALSTSVLPTSAPLAAVPAEVRPPSAKPVEGREGAKTTNAPEIGRGAKANETRASDAPSVKSAADRARHGSSAGQQDDTHGGPQSQTSEASVRSNGAEGRTTLTSLANSVEGGKGLNSFAAQMAKESAAASDPARAVSGTQDQRLPAELVTLHFPAEDGLEGSLRVALRGPALRATIVSSDPASLALLESRLGELHRSLAERGFPQVQVAVHGAGRDLRTEAGSEAFDRSTRDESGADPRQARRDGLADRPDERHRRRPQQSSGERGQA